MLQYMLMMINGMLSGINIGIFIMNPNPWSAISASFVIAIGIFQAYNLTR